jgi:hypothetical protein
MRLECGVGFRATHGRAVVQVRAVTPIGDDPARLLGTISYRESEQMLGLIPIPINLGEVTYGAAERNFVVDLSNDCRSSLALAGMDVVARLGSPTKPEHRLHPGG